jgi:hypothetical protein
MLAPVTHILPTTLIRRERVLPVSGRVLVRLGQKVSATEVIAEGRQPAQHLILEIGRGLGVSDGEVAKYIIRKVGEEVKEKDIIAGPLGLFSRTVRAPCDGRITAIAGGQVFLEMEGPPYELRAGLSGVVSELIPDGAVIETTGSLVQGVWGNGQIDLGLLTNLTKTPGDELSAGLLDVSLRGAVVLGGSCLQAEVLKQAAQIPLRGLVLSSLAAELLPIASASPVAIILLEGFGKLPMNLQAYQILTAAEKSEAIVHACRWDRSRGERPEIIIPSPAGEAPDLQKPGDAGQLTAGKTVRILRSPYTARTGVLLSIRPGLTAFPSGIQVPAGVVKLANEDQVDVPLANLEVLE